MSKDNSDDNTVAEEEYEVERIVGHKVIKNRKQRKFSYFIKWLNYDDADNTWEKEDNVFATNMIVDYWSNISPTDPDRVLFEEIQSKKKDPIVLISPQPKVAQVISHASPSPPSSPVVKPVEESQLEQVEVVTEEPKGNKITNIISSFLYGGGKKKDTTEDVETEKKQSTESSSSSSSSPKPVQEQKKIDELYKKVTVPTATGSAKGKEKEVPVPRLPTPTVVAVENDDDDDDDEDFSPATTSPATTSADGTGTEVEELDVESVEDMAVDDEDEEVIKRPSRSANVKRTRSAYTDYFIEQHKKRKLYGERKDTEEEDDDDEGSVASSIESNDKKKEPTDTIIFDDSFAKDASLDWNKLAKKVEYIGREVENGPIYCIVSWEDEVRSFHSLELVRKKRPDLLIDALIDSLYKVEK